VYGLRAADRFGDYGLVGVAIVQTGDDSWTIDTLLLSCRIIGRDVESALLSAVSDNAAIAGATDLVGEFIASAKNAPARDCYPRHGFVAIDAAETAAAGVGTQRWKREVNSGRATWPAWIRRTDLTVTTLTGGSRVD
jgi:predicted enzyme involved in methoxymalonyl-ACP biosynthesis